MEDENYEYYIVQTRVSIGRVGLERVFSLQAGKL